MILGRGPTHPVSTGFAIDAARCVLMTARAALAAWHGALPAQTWPAALMLIARDYLALGQNPVAFRLYGAASAQARPDAEDAELRRLVAARLAERWAQASTDPSLFEHWRAGERMSLDAVSGLLEEELDRPEPRPAERGPQADVDEPPAVGRPPFAVKA